MIDNTLSRCVVLGSSRTGGGIGLVRKEENEEKKQEEERDQTTVLKSLCVK